MRDVIVAGGGVIGLSIAHALATEGRSVLVLNSGGAADATSWAAAGMLAPQSEAVHRDAFFDLCAASLRLYRGWACRLQEESGVDPEFATPGLLCVGASETEMDTLKMRMDWQREAGFDSELLTAEDVCRLEPKLTLPLAGAVHLPGESQVTPRRLLEALRGACSTVKVEIQNNHHVRGILRNGKYGDQAVGVQTEAGPISAGCVVIASGVHSAEMADLSPRARILPRKGQILSLTAPTPVFHRMIRWEHLYTVGRPNGELVVGATNENAGFDRSLTPAGIGGLLNRVQQLSSATATLAIREMWTGLRPATPDGLPVLGQAALQGLIYATGHYRNGILLAPITASIVAALVAGRTPPIPLEPYDPARFEV